MDYNYLFKHLMSLGLTEKTSSMLNMLILFVALVLIVYGFDYLIRKILMYVVPRLTRKSATQFDDYLLVNNVPRNLAHILPLWLFLGIAPYVFIDFPGVGILVVKALQLFGIVLMLWIVRSLLNTFRDYFKTLDNWKDKPIDSYIQVFMIFAWIAGFMFAFALISGVSILKFFTLLGAASAVIILVFKDTIMGFVASIQVSVNDMVRIGDWISFDKYGADGDVIEINLATVKVQNFDNTFTTIPTYALISDSFKNWRGMTSSNGRRIKRAVLIKQKSIKFLTSEDIKKLSDIELVSDYLQNITRDIDAHNSTKNSNKDFAINGRNLTNLGVFRKYIDLYLKNHSAINKEMTIMVRQLAPTPQGIPVEIYAFSSDKRWLNYEYIMADIFDHVLSAVSYFDLELYELPSGNLDINLPNTDSISQ